MGLDVLTATIQDLLNGLEKGEYTTRSLTTAYLDQIEKHNGYLHAVLDVGIRKKTLGRADVLDEKRQKGEIMGPLHGVPIIVKDNIATHPSLNFNTTTGNLPLQQSKVARNAPLVDKLLGAGAIIIGKANLSEFSWWKGEKVPSGFSAAGGQTQSAYVRGGLLKDDLPVGHSGPGGSSSGSAVAVSAGFTPASIGTETAGSLICPATRAALYTIKPSIGLVSQDGIIPISPVCDSAGPMTKSVADLALLMDVLVDADAPGRPEGGYVSALGKGWGGIRVAAVEAERWHLSDTQVHPEESVKTQTNSEINAAYDRIATLAGAFHRNVELKTIDENNEHAPRYLWDTFNVDFKPAIENYLAGLEESPVRTLQELVDMNIAMKDTELPPGKGGQDRLEKCLNPDMSKEEYDLTWKFWRSASREQGIDRILKDYDCDVIIGPADSGLPTYASASGYPIATLPLGILDFNGRPFGLAALAGHYQEAKLISLMSAWETTFKGVIPPPSLVKGQNGQA